MLILTRGLQDSIMIGDNIQIMILGVKGGQVRLGIDAPKDIAVHRQEIFDKIKEQEIKNNDKQNNE